MAGLLIVIVVAIAAFAALGVVMLVTSKRPPAAVPAAVPAGGQDAGTHPAPPTNVGPAPGLPSWAKRVSAAKGSSAVSVEYNKKLVGDANRAGVRYDLVMWGDSITAAVALRYSREWKKHFGEYRSAALGVGGDTVEELVHRIVAGGEKFDQGPRCAIILIGINNLNASHAPPEDKLDFLVGWMRATWPTTKIIIQALLPASFTTRVPATNAKYQAVARKHGVSFSTCGSTMDPKDKRLFRDGLHPDSAGYDLLFGCLKPVVAGALAQA